MSVIFLALTFSIGLFVGQDPETGELSFGFNPENSFTGRTLNFVATSVGLPKIIGDADTPEELAFSDDDSDNNIELQQDDGVLTEEGNSTSTSRSNDSQVVPTSPDSETIPDSARDDEQRTTSSRTATSSDQTSNSEDNTDPSDDQPAPSPTTNDDSDPSPSTTTGTTIDNDGRDPFGLPADDFEIIRFDSFSDGQLDTNLWEPSQGLNFDFWRQAQATNPFENSCYTRDQVFESNGSLNIQIRATTDSETQQGLCKGYGTDRFQAVGGWLSSNSPNGGFVVEPGQYVETKISFPLNGNDSLNWFQIDFTETEGPDGFISPFNSFTNAVCTQHRHSSGNVNRCNGGGLAKSNNESLVIGTLWETNGAITIYYNGTKVDEFDNSLAENHTQQKLRLNFSYRVPGFSSGGLGRVLPSENSPQTVEIDYVDQYEIVG